VPGAHLCILGVDTALRKTGYGVIRGAGGSWRADDHGVICNPSGRPVAEALRHLHDEIAALLRRYRPRAVAVEGIFHFRNARAALALGQARGAVLVACAEAKVEVYEYAPREVKRSATGYGQAEKPQVARMVAAMLGLEEPPPADAADALALALCHANAGTARALGLARRLCGPADREAPETVP